MYTNFAKFIHQHGTPLAIPVGISTGINLVNASVYQSVTDARIQADAVSALQAALKTPFMVTAMDLSTEAEAFGCQIHMPEDEVPTVLGRLVVNLAQAEALHVPHAGDKRTAVHLETVRLLSRTGTTPVLAGCIGPFSLAGRLFGVSEALEATVLDPDVLTRLLEKSTQFLIEYATAFREAGAFGIIMAEPVAGLLSPRSLGKFSSPYVRQIIEAVQTPEYAVILHNCAAKINHLPKVLASGAEIYHFGAPMDMLAALQQAGDDVVLGGNLDPSAVFMNSTAAQVRETTRQLLRECGSYQNFFPSSGCDLPAGIPLENLQAFMDCVAAYPEM